MDYNVLFWFVPAASVLALAFAAYFYKQMKAESEGTERMAYIAKAVRQGAMAYLKQQYKVVAVVFVCLAAIFAIMAYVLKVEDLKNAIKCLDEALKIYPGRTNK